MGNGGRESLGGVDVLSDILKPNETNTIHPCRPIDVNISQ